MDDTAQVREQAAAAGEQSAHDNLDRVIERAQNCLLALQHPEGYWQAALEANAEMNAEYIIFMHFMGCVEPELQAKLSNYLLEVQQADGSWNLFPGGEGYFSTTVESYFALKLAGMRAGDDKITAARRWVLTRGGIPKAGMLARFYLACLGQVQWNATVAVPVEIALLRPTWPVNVYDLSSWARGTLFGLMLLQATQPVVKVSYEAGVLELYIEPPHFTKFGLPRGRRRLSLRTAFNQLDCLLRLYNRHPLKGMRQRALAAAEKWLLEHQEENGSWGGIEPCYLISAMALKGLGYRTDHPVLAKAISASRELLWDLGNERTMCTPCVSPNWDTAWAARALLDSGCPGNHPALRHAGQWLIDHQIFKPGDWSIKRPNLAPGGWAFEFYNDHYPDVDDSAVIVGVLAETAMENMDARQRAVAVGCNWVIGMQSRDGGFSAFDADNDSDWLNSLPYSELGVATDPTCPDLTGRVLEMMAAAGYRADHPVAARAIAWLRRHQSPDGSWWGRWGVNYIYGTFSALCGLRAIGLGPEDPMMGRGAAWLKAKQNPDGGWGESCLSDRDPTWRGKGPSTASQTAWAVMGLLAGDAAPGEALERGVRWLTQRQNAQGGWDEPEFTGTGFPNHFYLRYHMYALYFPLIALGRYRRWLHSAGR